MKLSMWILEDWFRIRGVRTESDIKNGKMSLNGARIGDNNGLHNIVCICPAEQISPSPRHIGSSAFLHDDDRMILYGISPSEAINMGNEAFEYYNAWEASLYQKITGDTSLQELLEIAHLALERPMAIRNNRGWIYAITSGYGEHVHPLWKEFMANDHSEASVDRAPSDIVPASVLNESQPTIAQASDYEGSLLYAAIWADGERIGSITAYENNEPFSQRDIQIMGVFQGITAIFVSIDKNILRSRSFLSEFMKAKLNNESPEKYDVEGILRHLNWTSSDEYIVLCSEGIGAPNEAALSRLCDDLEDQLHEAQAFVRGDHLTAVVNLTRFGSRKKLIDHLKKTIPQNYFRWGISHEFNDIYSFTDYYLQALYAQRQGSRTGSAYQTMRQVAYPCIQEHSLRAPWIKTLGHPDLVKLYNYDQKHHSDYLETLYWFLFFSCNHTDAAKEMSLHRNTMIYRVNRITEMVTADLDDVKERQLMLLSFLLFYPEVTRKDLKSNG